MFCPIITLESMERRASMTPATVDFVLWEAVLALHFKAAGAVRLVCPLMVGVPCGGAGDSASRDNLFDNELFRAARRALPRVVPAATLRLVDRAIAAAGPPGSRLCPSLAGATMVRRLMHFDNPFSSDNAFFHSTTSCARRRRRRRAEPSSGRRASGHRPLPPSSQCSGRAFCPTTRACSPVVRWTQRCVCARCVCMARSFPTLFIFCFVLTLELSVRGSCLVRARPRAVAGALLADAAAGASRGATSGTREPRNP